MEYHFHPAAKIEKKRVTIRVHAVKVTSVKLNPEGTT
jgi:hypothetical protein